MQARLDLPGANRARSLVASDSVDAAVGADAADESKTNIRDIEIFYSFCPGRA
jgi:hypothetical protein